MKIDLKQKVSLKDFEYYPQTELKKRAYDRLYKELLSIISKRIEITQDTAKGSIDTIFSLKMVILPDHYWKGIISSLQDIKIAMERKEDIEPHMKALCNWLRD